MSKWDKHSRKWEPSFKQRLGDRDVAKNKPVRKMYVVMPPRPRYDDQWSKILPQTWNVFMDEYYYEYKSLTYDEMIELKLRGYTIRAT
jgi:hypothetical protein